MQGYKIISKKFNYKEGHNKINTHNTLDHEQAKNKLMYLLSRANIKVYSEVIFENNKRADVYLPDKMIVLEVLHSETIDKFNKKVEGYPELVWVIPLKAEEILDPLFGYEILRSKMEEYT